ncbi:hypothetical protein GCM10017687_75170 [Streptomyces echinatus]
MWLGLGALWALILLCHQFTGVVASLGALATLLAARPARTALLRLGAGLVLALLVLWLWPYYDFFALFSAGADLEAIHRPLYQDLAARFGLVLLGWRRWGCGGGGTAGIRWSSSSSSVCWCSRRGACPGTTPGAARCPPRSSRRSSRPRWRPCRRGGGRCAGAGRACCSPRLLWGRGRRPGRSGTWWNGTRCPA